MKQMIFTAILIFAFYFAAFAQTDVSSCPKIKNKAPETVYENNKTFKVSASFENENSSLISKFDWIVVKDDEVIIKNSEKIIEIDTQNAEREYVITVLAQATEERCQNLAMAKAIVIPNVGSPLILDEYAEVQCKDSKIANFLHLSILIKGVLIRKEKII
jgi:archaellin